MIPPPPDPSVLLNATGRTRIADAIAWIAEGHPLASDADRHEVLEALVGIGRGDGYLRALRRLARDVAASDLDSAAVLFEPGKITPASKFRRALEMLASTCREKSLTKVNAGAVIAAQRSDSFTVETLCAVAGLSYSELRLRVPELPAESTGPWAPSQVRRAFELIDALVRGTVNSGLPGTISARAIDLIQARGSRSGWMLVDEQFTKGVTYETLLAQRANGGSWLAHRNRTSNKLAPLLAYRVCKILEERGLAYRRSTSVGGVTAPQEMRELSGCDKQIGVLVLTQMGRPAYAVIFSSARDSGTASKNTARLRAMKRAPRLPVAIVVAGPGWAARNETADLAADFQGRVYSERAIDELVAAIEIATT